MPGIFESPYFLLQLNKSMWKHYLLYDVWNSLLLVLIVFRGINITTRSKNTWHTKKVFLDFKSVSFFSFPLFHRSYYSHKDIFICKLRGLRPLPLSLLSSIMSENGQPEASCGLGWPQCTSLSFENHHASTWKPTPVSLQNIFHQRDVCHCPQFFFFNPILCNGGGLDNEIWHKVHTTQRQF